MRISPVASLVVLAIVVGSCTDVVAPPDSITPPADVTVTLAGTNSARITWTAPPEADFVESYSVFRDAVKIGESTTTTYLDDGLEQGKTYKYRVSANGQLGLVSALSAETLAATITVPDVTPPTVISTNPTPNAAAIPLTSIVSAVFSEPMDPATITGTTFFLKTSAGALIPGTVAYDAATLTARFTPAAAMPNASTVSASITSEVKDLSGNSLASQLTFSFTTRDEVPPSVVTTSPVAGATGTPVTAAIAVTFNEPIDPASINTSSFTLAATAGGAAVTGTVSFDISTRTATFNHSAPLESSTAYTATVAGTVKDPAGNAMGTAFSFSFTTADVTAPSVSSVSPNDGATGVPSSVAVSVNFSEAMDPATVNASTVLVKLTSSGASVAGSVSYNPATSTASFVPSAGLAFSTGYTVIVTTDARDIAGNPLATAFSSAFVTTNAPDTTAPTILSVSPADGTAGVSITEVVSVTFSEAMDPATINATTVSLKSLVTSALVPATVAYDVGTKTASLEPSSSLSFGSGYMVTVSEGASDLAGNGLASAVVSTFTTTSAPDVTPPSVLSAVPSNGAANVSVLTAIAVTFSEAMNPATINASTILLKVTATSAAISGTVGYDAGTNTATFIPAGGSLAFGTAYTLTATGAADVAGNAMATGFTSGFTTATAPDLTPPIVTGSSPVNGATGVSATVAATVTFSEPMNPATVIGSTVILSVTATGAPLAATVTYSTATNTATITPSAPLSSSTRYTLAVTPGARDLAGNSLGAEFSISFTTADSGAPVVVSSVPANGATNVSVSNALTVDFSEPMNASTINGSTITLRVTATSAPVAGTVTYGGASNTATFTPSAQLSGSTGYTLAVSTGAQDVAGNPLASSFSSSFTTADITRPTVLSTVPTNGATNVAVASAIRAVFSEAMNAGTINGSSITLRVTATSAAVAGSVSYSGSTNTATFTPSAALASSTGYTLTVSTGVQDLAGNSLASPFTASFTTADVIRPTVTSTVPTNSATNVAVSSTVSVTFSEAMNATTITGSTITLHVTATSAPVSGTVSYSGATNTATFTPSAQLSGSTGYTITVTTGAQDLAGNSLASPFTASFVTVDTTPPSVVSTTPANGTTAVFTKSLLTVTFSEPMDPATIDATTITLKVTLSGNPRTGTVTYDAASRTATFKPTVDLTYDTGLTLTVNTGVKDLAGNAMIANVVTNFRTLQKLWGQPYFAGTNDIGGDSSQPEIHLHLRFTQDDTILGRPADCEPLPDANCDMFPLNAAAAAVVGPLDDVSAATVTQITGTFNQPNISFSITLANGRTFNFTGTVIASDRMQVTMSGATLPSPISYLLSRF